MPMVFSTHQRYTERVRWLCKSVVARNLGRDNVVYCDSLRTGRFGDRIPVGAIFSVHMHTGPGTHPAFYAVGTGLFPGAKWPGSNLNHSYYLAPRLKKVWSYTSFSSICLYGKLYGEFLDLSVIIK